MGVQLAIGETTLVGYLNFFPKKMVPAAASGFGLSGIVGSLIILSMKSSPFIVQHEGIIFLTTSLCVIPFIVVHYVLHRKQSSLTYIWEEKKAVEAQAWDSVVKSIVDEDGNTDGRMIEEDWQSVITQDLAAADNVQLSWAGFKIVFSKVGFYLVNIFLVYWLEITV